jgi:dihydrofolate reductase
MGRLVAGTFVSVDGVMQAPGGPDEDRDGGFEHGGWLVPHFDEELGVLMVGLMDRADAILLGRKTYETFIQHWPHIGDEDPIARKLNAAPKYVASRTLETADWNNTTVLTGGLPDEIARLKEQYDEVHVPGSATLIQSLLSDDLVDEFVVIVFPVVIGEGKRLFGDGTLARTLRLVESKALGSGVVVQRLERVGELEYGAVGLETEQAAAAT